MSVLWIFEPFNAATHTALREIFHLGMSTRLNRTHANCMRVQWEDDNQADMSKSHHWHAIRKAL